MVKGIAKAMLALFFLTLLKNADIISANTAHIYTHIYTKCISAIRLVLVSLLSSCFV